MNSQEDPLRKAMRNSKQGFTHQQSESDHNHGDVFQMLWDCRFCGTKKLLGLDHRHCPNCGAPQNPEWRYFPSEADIKFVTDKDYTYSGADVICPFCQQPNSKAAKFCVSCGGDLVNAKDAAIKGRIDSKDAKSQVDDVVKEKFERDLGIQAKPQKLLGGINPAIPIILIVGLIIACIAGFIYLNGSTYESRLSVTSVNWETGVTMQQLVAQSGRDWRDSVPGGAYNVSCQPQQRAYQESVQVQCGYDFVDQGDGTGKRVPKYCTETQTRYETDQMCSYTVDVWVTLRDITASGGLNEPIATPVFSAPVGTGRIRRTGDYLILRVNFRDTQGGQAYEYNPQTESEWRSFRENQRFSVQINRLGIVQWETLKEVRE
ncbi:MAG: zinc ribbon domain-containing protein [Anaerolineae bacterium]|nr:zinc ribbon domain-containing protein [Anaerolineae bacterium]